jgi:hypothetical protein
MIEAIATKMRSEAEILSLQGAVCDWLPTLELPRPRSVEGVVDRALVLHGMLQLAFGAPTSAISFWLENEGLIGSLSRRECGILQSFVGQVDESTRDSLFWYIEALWALAWAGSFVSALPINQPVGDSLASHLPSIRNGESAKKFRETFRLRSSKDCFEKLDLYYRAHWLARERSLTIADPGVFNLDIIMERRKSLEWVNYSDVEDWDECDQST